MGALEDGTKEILAVWDGIHESKASWLEVLRDLNARGLTASPKLAVGDGALGFWAALEEEHSQVREQRCWVHKTSNVLDKLSQSVQPYAKKLIHGDGLSPQGRRCSVHVLRFSGRTLDAHPDDESDRIGVRHGAAPDAADEGLRFSIGDVNDGFQTRDAGRAPLAEAEQRAVARSCDSERRFHRRRHGESGLNGDRRDMFNPGSYTTFDNISEILHRIRVSGLKHLSKVAWRLFKPKKDAKRVLRLGSKK